MSSWRDRPFAATLSALPVVASVAYPVLFYLLNERIPPIAFVAAACVLLSSRALADRGGWIAALRWPLLVAAGMIAALSWIDAAAAAKAYPVAVSGVLALTFGASLWQSESLVERIARLKNRAMDPAARRYCRRVTLMWTIWLILNALICGFLALAGSLAVWTLWTGLVAYLVMGFLFAGEYMVRRIVLRRHATG